MWKNIIWKNNGEGIERKGKGGSYEKGEKKKVGEWGWVV